MCRVGEYIQTQSISFRGACIFINDGKKEYLLDEKLTPEKELQLRKKQFGSFAFFIIDEANNKVALNKYLPLIKYFYRDTGYRNSKGRYSKGQNIPVWEKRWRQVVMEKGDVSFEEVDFNNFNQIGLPKDGKDFDCEWMIAVRKDERGNRQWAMPVFAPCLRNGLNDHNTLRFIVTDHYWDSSFHRYYKHSFFALNYNFSTPVERIFEASNNRETKQIRMILHGFLHPAILHYKFYRHVLGLGHNHDERYGASECAEWQRVLRAAVPDRSINQIKRFDSLEKYGSKKGFRYIKKNQFNGFHQAIKGGINAYLKKLSSFFSESATILLQHVDYESSPNVAWCMLNMLGSEQEVNRQSNYLPFLVMEGMCYNWNDEIPILNLYVTTFFLKFRETNKSMIRSATADKNFRTYHGNRPVHEWRHKYE